MPLSDFHESMKGWVPAQAPEESKPQIPTSEVQQSPYLRAILPLPLQYSVDTVKQYNTPALSRFRIAPLPPNGSPSLISAAATVINSTVHEFINVAAAGPNGAIQFNSGGALSGNNSLFWNNISSVLSIIGTLTLTIPLAVTSGGTGTSTPSLIAGPGISVTGTWPNQTISNTGVLSLNGEVGALTLVAGAGITITPVGTNITIASVSSPGGLWNVVSKNSAYAAVAGDMVIADTTAPFTVTLPLASANSGKSIRVKKVTADVNTITVAISGADLIDGQATQTFNSQYTDLEVTSDGGTNWWIA